MSASLGLFRLQQVDSQIDRVRMQLDAIRQTLENDTELREALTRAETAQVENHHASHALKIAEAEVDAQRIKIEQAEASLYSGNVKNPKELQDLQKEVASLKKYITTLEERQLETMLKAETAENDLQKARTELEKIKSRLGSEHGKLIEEQSTLNKQLERLAEEREASLAPIDINLLDVYEGLRQQKRGMAVTEIADNACSACGTTLNASVQQNARSQKLLVNCPTCGRILFAN